MKSGLILIGLKLYVYTDITSGGIETLPGYDKLKEDQLQQFGMLRHLKKRLTKLLFLRKWGRGLKRVHWYFRSTNFAYGCF